MMEILTEASPRVEYWYSPPVEPRLRGANIHVAVLFRLPWLVKDIRPRCHEEVTAKYLDRSPNIDMLKPLSEYFRENGENLDSDDESDSDTDPNIVDDIANILKDVAPQSCFVQLHFAVPISEPKPVVCPPPLVDLARTFEVGFPLTSDVLCSVKRKLQLTADDRATIEQATRDLSGNDEKRRQKYGRITDNNIEQICSKTVLLLKDPTQSASDLIRKVMGYQDTKTPSKKNLLSIRKRAKTLYKKVMRKSHRQFFVENCGFVIHETHNFLGASPDLRVCCSCHGKGLCLIKCPLSIRSKLPSQENWPTHLGYNNDLKRASLLVNSPFFYQLQTQMGILKLKYCDFFVFTNRGYQLERIEFDTQLWDHIVPIVSHFWNKYILEELLMGEHAPQTTSGRRQTSRELFDHSYVREWRATDVSMSHRAITRALTVPPVTSVSLCHLCGFEEESEEPVCRLDCSDRCQRWAHAQCVRLTHDEKEPLPESWMCDTCAEMS